MTNDHFLSIPLSTLLSLRQLFDVQFSGSPIELFEFISCTSIIRLKECVLPSFSVPPWKSAMSCFRQALSMIAWKWVPSQQIIWSWCSGSTTILLEPLSANVVVRLSYPWPRSALTVIGLRYCSPRSSRTMCTSLWAHNSIYSRPLQLHSHLLFQCSNHYMGRRIWFFLYRLHN